MEVTEIIDSILPHFGLTSNKFEVQKTGSGHINQTFLVKGKTSYILQRINKTVFTQPDRIAKNIRLAAAYLSTHYPDYLFLSPKVSNQHEEMVYDQNGDPWRLFPYIDHCVTLNELHDPQEAYEAARGFGKLTRNLNDISLEGFQSTIDNFHHLGIRFQQLENALQKASEAVKISASSAIEKALEYSFLVSEYEDLIRRGKLNERIVHNDTKINNILFDQNSKKALCVIDLDTLMQGFFIYDLGDMVRTFVSPVSEEEKDLSAIEFRRSFYDALLEGYLSEMGYCLSEDEKKSIPFAGMMMTYIMAIRFLADYLNGNIYYQIHYPEQNLVRANNQLKLLEKIEKNLRPVF